MMKRIEPQNRVFMLPCCVLTEKNCFDNVPLLHDVCAMNFKGPIQCKTHFSSVFSINNPPAGQSITRRKKKSVLYTWGFTFHKPCTEAYSSVKQNYCGSNKALLFACTRRLVKVGSPPQNCLRNTGVMWDL